MVMVMVMVVMVVVMVMVMVIIVLTSLDLRSDELARHRRSHSGIKPYKCQVGKASSFSFSIILIKYVSF